MKKGGSDSNRRLSGQFFHKFNFRKDSGYAESLRETLGKRCNRESLNK